MISNKKQLTISVLKKTLEDSKYNTPALKWAIPIYIGMAFSILLVAYFAGGKQGFITAGFILLMVTVVIMVVFIICKRNINSIEKMDFHLAEAVVVDKQVETDGDDNKSYILHFGEYGKYHAFSGEYNSARAGQSFYLLFLRNSKTIKLIFKKSMWEINDAEFTAENCIYLPKK